MQNVTVSPESKVLADANCINISCAVLFVLVSCKTRYGPVHEISNNVVCATSKASYQRSLIRAIACRLNIL